MCIRDRDNIYQGFDRGELATNESLVERVAHLSETFGRPLASSTRARALLGLGRSAARGQPTRVEAFRR